MRDKKPAVVLVFSDNDDDYDRESVRHLLLALRNDMPPIKPIRKPLILVKGREQARVHKNMAEIARVIKTTQKGFAVRMVFAHQDCDAIEPAHEGLAASIESGLQAHGIDAIAVTPAWEMEAWWFLWPDAVVAVYNKWRRPARTGTRVGLLQNAKEELRRAVRPHGRSHPVRDYEESDGPKIAMKVKELGLIDQPDAVSDSFVRFKKRVQALKF